MGSQTSKYLTKTQIIAIESWKDFQKIIGSPKYRTWAFRGQSNSDWPLHSSLARHLLEYKIHPDAWIEQEERIFRIFRRKAHLFLQHVPEESDEYQWLALMQHHGSPTRLIDFTWSPYVATFFALEKATTDCAIWGVSYSEVWQVKHKFPDEKKPMTPGLRTSGNYKKFFLNNKVPFVMAGEPFIMNQRLIAQSGTFLIPGVLDIPVEGILAGYPNPEKILVKFILKSSKIRDEAMMELYAMNITNATLFPGLDGMARSLAYELEFNWAFNPKTMETYPGYE